MRIDYLASKKRVVLWAVLHLVALVAVPTAARANTINVSSSGPDLVADAYCTLREALTGGFSECAPTGGAGPLVVQLPAGTQNWSDADASGTALPPILANMTIRGAGAGATRLTASPTSDLRLFDVRAPSVTIEGITFEGWTGDMPQGVGGGVILQEQGSELFVKDCVFIENRSSLGIGQGAAISTWNESASPTKLTIERTTFEDNTAYYAGAVWASGASVTIVDSIFRGNTATSVGGALRVVTNSAAQVVSISGSEFVDNSVPDPVYGNAGAVTLEGPGTFTITGSTFTSNVAPGYGALWAHEVILTIDSCTFEDNAAPAADAGAVASDGVLHVVDSLFKGNTALASGGALTCGFGSGSCLVERTRFEGNRAGMGGAILSGPKGLTATDSIFFDNAADFLSLTLVATDNKATEGADTAGFTLDRRVLASGIRAQGPSNISGSCFLGQTGQIVIGAGVAVDARDNFWTASDPTVRGDASVDSSDALDVAPAGCDPLRTPALGSATLTATYSGEATAGVDYVALPANIVMGPGVSTLPLEVMPIFDEIVDNGESVTMLAVYPGGSSAGASVQILDGVSSDLRIASSVDHETATVGDELVFTLTVTNDGLGPAMNVVVTDILPAGLYPLSVDAAGPLGVTVQCVPGQPVTCTIPLLAATEVVSVTVRARADEAGEVQNSAEVAVESDTNPANNSSMLVVTVFPAPDDGASGAGAGGAEAAGGAGTGVPGTGEPGTGEAGSGGVRTANGGAGDVEAGDAGAADGGDPAGRAVTRAPAGCGCRMPGDAPRTSSLLWTLPIAIAAGVLRRRRKHQGCPDSRSAR